MNYNTRVSKLNLYVKASCSAVLLSGSLVGYGFTKDAFAQTKENSNDISEHVASVQRELDKAMAKAKVEINRLHHLNATELRSYQEDIEDAQSQDDIKQIVTDAKEEDRLSAQEITDNSLKHSSNNKNSDLNSDQTTSTKLDEIMKDLDAFSKKVDTRQQNNTTTSKEDSSATSNFTTERPTTDASERSHLNKDEATSVLDELDNLKNEVGQDKQSTDTSTTEDKASSELKTSIKDKVEEAKDDHSNESVLNNLEKADKLTQSQQKESSAIPHNASLQDELTAPEKIDQAITKIEDKPNETTQRYTDHKLEQLRNLRQHVNDNQDLSSTQKHNIEKDITTVRNNVKNNREALLDRLNHTSNKQATVEKIVGDLFSKNEAQHILKDINTKGMSDKQITDQLMKRLDGLTTTTGDDILTSMFDQTSDKEKLLKILLSTRLGNSEATSIAQRLANEKLPNSELVNRLKEEYKTHDSLTSDDILKDVLEHSSNPKQTIETLLATKLNQAKAHALADIIMQAQTGKADMLALVKNALNGKANDLLGLQQRFGQAKNKLDYILAPITQRPSLLDRISGNSHQPITLPQGSDLLSNLTGGSLLGGLNSGNSLLDNIPDIPDPVQGLSLGNLDSDGGLLSGLFDDDGNLSLPATGELVKKSALPITTILVLIGGTFIWVGHRKRRHHSNN
ncbi:hypothetical protein BUY45_01440 [Staphylococcus devriesei]|uniref:Protein G-related albumin-binding (GA) module domain-containing protein n=1 Tax=Staphylococcus devriesei TaxID=586733 RepID=A0A2T4L2C1_9STAP|nr:GA module-containing protein [Staphylococcus devriesei]PTF04979.1 hypothetical protein BUY45_01440 [Staphylococcus devriesei]PTF15905.1 hypothetical protein BUY48_04895 [Staphylococcus devriesei]